MKPPHVDDIVASVEEAVRRAYALGRADAMKRVVELAQSDDPSLRAVALLGPAEPARPAPSPTLLNAPQPTPAQNAPHHPDPDHPEIHSHEQAADHEDAKHEARQAEAAAPPSVPTTPAQPPAQKPGPEPARKPVSAGGFLADFFYPLGSKKR